MDEYGYEDYEQDYEEAAPQERPNPVKTLRDRGDKAVKELKETRERLAELERENRQLKLGDTLKAAGVPTLVANLVPADITADKVGDWLKENGFTASAPAQPEAQTQVTAPPAVEPAEAQQIQAMQQLSAGAPAPSGQPTEADLRALDYNSLRALFTQARPPQR